MSCSAGAAVAASKSIAKRGVELKAREGYKSWGSGTSRPRRALLLLTPKGQTREYPCVFFVGELSRMACGPSTARLLVRHAGLGRPPRFLQLPQRCVLHAVHRSSVPSILYTNTALSVISPNPHKPVFFSPPKLRSQNPQNRGIATYNI